LLFEGYQFAEQSFAVARWPSWKGHLAQVEKALLAILLPDSRRQYLLPGHRLRCVRRGDRPYFSIR